MLTSIREGSSADFNNNFNKRNRKKTVVETLQLKTRDTRIDENSLKQHKKE
jgi:hypothetical protein